MLKHIINKPDDVSSYIDKNRSKFMAAGSKSNWSESKRILHFLDKENCLEEFLTIYELDYNLTLEDIYLALNKDSNKCTVCNNKTTFVNYKRGFKSTCSSKCLSIIRSDRMKGDNNSIHKVNKDRLKEIGKENGIRIKKMISDGTFTPNIANSKRCKPIEVLINDNIIKCRSSWEAYFYIMNPHLDYEKLRIPYYSSIDKKIRTYIVDFIDYENRVVYEIGSSTEKSNITNKEKFNSLNSWCKENNFNFVLITEHWFSKNYNKKIIRNQPNKILLEKRLKQFNNEN